MSDEMNNQYGDDTQAAVELASAEDRGDTIVEEPVAEPEVVAEPVDNAEQNVEPKAEEVNETEETAEAQASEEETTAEGAEGAETNSKGTVPTSRFEAVLAKQRMLEDQLAKANANKQLTEATQQDEPAPVEFDFTAAENEYITLVQEGESVKAQQLRSEIRDAEREAIMRDVNSSKAPDISIDSIKQELAYDTAIQDNLAKFPILDQSSEGFDQLAIDHCNAIQTGYTNQGYAPADALNMAVNAVMNTYHPHLINPQVEVPPVEVNAQQPVPKPPGTVQSDVTNKVTAASQQPPSAANVGASGASEGANSGIDIMAMSDDQLQSFMEKNPDQAKQLRGDFI